MFSHRANVSLGAKEMPQRPQDRWAAMHPQGTQPPEGGRGCEGDPMRIFRGPKARRNRDTSHI